MPAAAHVCYVCINLFVYSVDGHRPEVDDRRPQVDHRPTFWRRPSTKVDDRPTSRPTSSTSRTFCQSLRSPQLGGFTLHGFQSGRCEPPSCPVEGLSGFGGSRKVPSPTPDGRPFEGDDRPPRVGRPSHFCRWPSYFCRWPLRSTDDRRPHSSVALRCSFAC